MKHQNISDHPDGWLVRVVVNGNLHQKFVPRRKSIRAAIRARNELRKLRRARSKFRGVAPSRGGKWQAHIVHRHRFYYLGLYNREEEAALMYDVAARDLHGANARVNFPE